MKSIVTISTTFLSLLFFVSCGSKEQQNTEQTEISSPLEAPPEEPVDVTRGIGKFTNVELTHPLDKAMIAKGTEVYDLKCSSCHRLTEEKLVGPGWKGVTDRRTPEWIMNFSTNTDEMLNKDPEAQAMLEICMVRMPNQNLSDEDARAIVEFMRKNDGKN
jgi:mono/diheme cytochrome c family protein